MNYLDATRPAIAGVGWVASLVPPPSRMRYKPRRRVGTRESSCNCSEAIFVGVVGYWVRKSRGGAEAREESLSIYAQFLHQGVA